MSMPKITITVGVILVALGLGSYFGTGSASITAMIPSFFGVVVLGLGLLATRDGLRKHAIHAALVVGLLGVVAPSMRMVKALGEDFAFSTAFAVQLAMAAICLAYVVLGVWSFIAARRAS